MEVVARLTSRQDERLAGGRQLHGSTESVE